MSSFDKLSVTMRTFLLSVQVGYLLKLSGSPEQFINPFQSNFSANRILPSSYLFTPFIPAIFVQAQTCEYNAQSPVRIKTHGLLRNRETTTCVICWPKSVLHEEERRTGSNRGAGATKTCQTSSTSEQTRKILMPDEVRHRIEKG
jgi:hypothetical protein